MNSSCLFYTSCAQGKFVTSIPRTRSSQTQEVFTEVAAGCRAQSFQCSNSLVGLSASFSCQGITTPTPHKRPLYPDDEDEYITQDDRDDDEQ